MPAPSIPTEAFLRVNLSAGLTEGELSQLSKRAEKEGSLDAALVEVIRNGLRRTPRAAKGGRR